MTDQPAPAAQRPDLTVDTDAVAPERAGEEHTHPPFETCDDCQRRAFPDSTGLDKPARTADLRQRYAEAIDATYTDVEAFDAEAAADAVMAVRDTELDELRNETAMQQGVIADYRVENTALRNKLAVRDTELEQARTEAARSGEALYREQGALADARDLLTTQATERDAALAELADLKRWCETEGQERAAERDTALREARQYGQRNVERLCAAAIELRQARAELARRDAAESADAAAGSYAGRAEAAEAALATALDGGQQPTDPAARLRAHALTPDGTHLYLSTGCLHGDHTYCQNRHGVLGVKRPARCKWCSAPCVCDCHHEPAAQQPNLVHPDGEQQVSSPPQVDESGRATPTVVHACPMPDDQGIMPCCRRPPFEVRGERLTKDPALVTCRPLPVDQLADGHAVDDDEPEADRA